MNIDFDYYKFPKEKRIKYDVKIDLSGLDVKDDASIQETDENNKVTDVNLAEIIDEKINYVYTYATPVAMGSRDPAFEKSRFYFYVKDSDGNFVVDYNGNVQYNWRIIGENVTEPELIDFNANPNPNTINLFDSVIANIVPRHTRFANSTTPITEKGIFAALGFFGSNDLNISDKPDTYMGEGYMNLKNDLGESDTEYRGCLTRKKFYSSVNRVTEKLLQHGIETVIKEYNGEKNDVGVDINATGLWPFYNFYISRAYAPYFIAKKMADGGMDIINPSDVTPFNLSIKEVFKAYYEPADELYDSFIGALRSLFTSINSSVLVNSFVDDSDIGLVKTPIQASDSDINITAIDNNGDDKLIIKTDYTYNGNVYPRVLYAYYTDNGKNYLIQKDSDYAIQFKYELPSNTAVNDIIDSLPKIRKQINRAAGIISTSFITVGIAASALAGAIESVSNSRNYLNDLDKIIKRIRWYQHYTNESIFPDRQFLRDGDESDDPQGPMTDDVFTHDKRMCRLLIPVYMGTRKIKKRVKNIFGHMKTKYVKVDLGVRWVELNFVDTKVYEKYRTNDKPLGKTSSVNKRINSVYANGNVVTCTLKSAISDTIMATKPFPDTVSFTTVGLLHTKLNGSFSGKIIDSTHIQFTVDTASFANYSSTGGTLSKIILPFDKTKEPDVAKNITVRYQMPHLPYDSELRKKVFTEFGSFDQSIYANKSRNGDYKVDIAGNIVLNNDIQGWEIFHQSSKSIKDMRSGIDIYNKVQFLMQLLVDEFGKNRVYLIETTRSYEDQEKLQLGGLVSSFLSWHNFGLAVKIKITKADLITAIEDGSDDMMRLLDIAEAFVNGCQQGHYGEPVNAVWCGQLVTGPDLFVWEFLPIGVGHKDALKFRDSAYAQIDPVVSNGYVNVTKKGYIVDTATYLTANEPYILKNSKALNEATIINGDKWVEAKKINNFIIPNSLILKDIKEFLLLVQGKMNANGTDLMGRRMVSEWKSNNQKSFDQLVIFNSLIGNYAVSRGLLSGDYIDKFSHIVDRYYKTDPIKFVQLYLGDAYKDIKISIDDFSDSSYISLNDGKLTTYVLDARSTHREGNGNTFGQKQLDFNSVEFGQYQGGVFIKEGDDRIIDIKTDLPVISGYDDLGNPIDGDARIIHALIADQLYNEFTQIKDNFTNLKIKFMYDSFYNSPNYVQVDMLENEFGVINTQDLLTFPQLRDMYARIKINNQKADFDGTVKGAGANIEDMEPDSETNLTQSVYEKLLSTSQQVGARKALLTREKPLIQPIEARNKIEKTIQLLNKNRMPKATDLL